MRYLKRDKTVPQLIPPVPLSAITNDREREVIEQLMAQLPGSARLYHNFDLLTSEYRNGRGAKTQLKEGEIDVIVLLQDGSIIVVEVKGRGIRYLRDTNQWQRGKGGQWISETSPFHQARDNAHRLMDCLEPILGEEAVKTIRHGYMVVFPFLEIKGDLAHDIHSVVHCNGSQMHQLGRQVQALPNKMSTHAGKCALSAKQIHDAILPEMRLVQSLRAGVDADVKTLLRLTEEQSDHLEILSKRKRALIEGVAGSGKSVLAVEQARRFAQQDKKVLLLCYNSALANWIAAGIKDELLENPIAGSIEVKTFHDFCARSCIDANIEFEPGEDQDYFWKEQAPELLMDCTQVNQHFDAIIVDEGQDFHGLWWTPIQGCLKADGALFVFCDPQQDIFNANGLSDLGLEESSFPLLKNCRNTKKIARFCDDIAQIETQSHQNAAEGSEVVFETITNDERRVDYVRDLLSKWVVDDGICPSRIAVLSPNKPERICLKDGISPCRVSLTGESSQWREGRQVLHTAVRGFKGLDAEFVILVDLPAPDTHRVFGTTDYYVAASRAIAVLHVVAKEVWSSPLQRVA